MSYLWRPLALIPAAVALGFGVAACGSDSGSERPTPTPATVDEPAPSPTPSLLSDVPSIEEARESLAASHPRLSVLVEAVESGDVEAVLESLKWLSLPCEDFQYRVGNACDADGLAPGTVLAFFAMEGFMGAFPRDDVRESISYDLAGRNPRLAAAVERADGSVTLVFLIDPAPDLVFPGGEPAGGAEETAVVFGTTATEQELVTVYDHRFEGSPPLEFIRYDQNVSGTEVTILGVSDECHGLEAAWHEEDESHRTDGLAR